MRLVSNDDIRKVCSTNYEAVLIAAQYARKINTNRIAKEQANNPDEEEMERPEFKVTSQALFDLVDSKIKFSNS